MTILLLNQFFWPDSAATSQLLTDLARGLKQRQHEVYALCASGGDYALRDESDDPEIETLRIKTVPFARSRVGRSLSYVSFLVLCAFRGLVMPRPDVVVTLTTPPLLPLLGTLIKFAKGSSHVIWEMDVYPDVAVDLKYIKRNGFLHRWTGRFADAARSRANGILVLGECMKRRVMERGVPESKIHVADNWADGTLIRPLPYSSGRSLLVLLYSGNLGLAHDADTISDAMQVLKNDPRFRFVFAGAGSLRRGLEARCRDLGITAATFRSYSERKRLGETLGSCDIGLITQQACCLGSVVPSKTYGLLAAGRPILFIGPAQSSVAAIIRRYDCGWQIDNNDVPALVQLLKMLVENPTQVQDAGLRARKAFEGNFDLPLGVGRICTVIEGLCAS
jgi:colanic acid biosynthesis glycosyl transferase WcaI